MRRTYIVAAAMTMAAFSIAVAEEFTAVVLKVEDSKVTFKKVTFKEEKKAEYGDEMSLPAAANVKVVKGKFDKETKKFVAGEPIEGGLKNEIFSKLGEKKGTKGIGGKLATIVTDADNKKITEIRLPQFGGGGGK